MKKTLEQLYKEHRGKISDKWSFYLTEYDRLFGPYRSHPVQLLEIGIQNGGSLELWDEYFPNAKKIVGCDIDPKCASLRYRSQRIGVVIGDANTDDCEREILGQASTFDIIIDDGSHKSGDIVRSFARYFPHLSEGGIYVAEDLHSSYWNNFEGGLHNPLSAMSFFKRLADIINHEHWRINKSDQDLVAAFRDEYGVNFEAVDFSKIHSVEFVNSLCILRMAAPEKNILGKRVIVGEEEYTTSEVKKYDGMLIQSMLVEVKDDGDLDVFELIAHGNVPDQSNLILERRIAEKEQIIQRLTTQIAEKEQTTRELVTQSNQLKNELEQVKAEVLGYALSRSWKMTRPLRMIMQWIHGRKNASKME
jgi:uncharacterized coiled-coil protein SlyX